MFMKIIIVLGLVSLTGIIFVLNTTNPADSGVVAILSVFILIYLVSLSFSTLLIFLAGRVVSRLFYSDRPSYINEKMTISRAYYYGSVLAFAPVVLIGFSSVGRLGVLEVFLVLILMLLGFVYVSRQLK